MLRVQCSETGQISGSSAISNILGGVEQEVRYDRDSDVLVGSTGSDSKYDFRLGINPLRGSTAHCPLGLRAHRLSIGKRERALDGPTSSRSIGPILCLLATSPSISNGSGFAIAVHFCTSMFWYFSWWYVVL